MNKTAEVWLKLGVPLLPSVPEEPGLGVRERRREWQHKDEPEPVEVYDFPQDALAKVMPCNIYGAAANVDFVNIGVGLS